MEHKKMFKVIKAGKLSNGMEHFKGSITHLSENSYCGPALCGETPAIAWVERPEKEVTCKNCLIIYYTLSKS